MKGVIVMADFVKAIYQAIIGVFETVFNLKGKDDTEDGSIFDKIKEALDSLFA